MPWLIKGQSPGKYRPSETRKKSKLKKINNNNNTFTFNKLKQTDLWKIFGKNYKGRFVVMNLN